MGFVTAAVAIGVLAGGLLEPGLLPPPPRAAQATETPQSEGELQQWYPPILQGGIVLFPSTLSGYVKRQNHALGPGDGGNSLRFGRDMDLPGSGLMPGIEVTHMRRRWVRLRWAVAGDRFTSRTQLQRPVLHDGKAFAQGENIHSRISMLFADFEVHIISPLRSGVRYTTPGRPGGGRPLRTEVGVLLGLRGFDFNTVFEGEQGGRVSLRQRGLMPKFGVRAAAALALEPFAEPGTYGIVFPHVITAFFEAMFGGWSQEFGDAEYNSFTAEFEVGVGYQFRNLFEVRLSYRAETTGVWIERDSQPGLKDDGDATRVDRAGIAITVLMGF